MITRKAILKKIDNPNLSLHDGDGYWYFIYDDARLFVGHSVFVMRLSQLTVDQWCEEAQVALNAVDELRKRYD